MATATRSPLTEQAEKLGNLAQYLSEGHLLEPVLRKAQAGDVWSGPVHQGFIAWIQMAVDMWVRNNLATGVRLVAESLHKRAEQVNQAANAMATGAAASVTIPPPAPLNYTPGRPPAYGDIGGGPQSKFNPDRMTELAQLLETTADDAVITFGRGLRSALEPPLPPPAAPGAPPAISPLPPDAHAAVGDPESSSPGSNAYLALADELHRAADDITRRVRALRLVDEPLPTAIPDANLVAEVGAAAANLVAGSETAEEQAAAPDTPTANPEYRGPAPVDEKPPPTQEQIDDANHKGDELAARAIKEDVLNHPDKMAAIVTEMNNHRGHPAFEAYAASFVEKFGAERMRKVPRALQAWQYGYNAGNPATHHPPKHTLPLGGPNRKPGPTEIEDVLYSFSATLATATHAEGREKLTKELDKLSHDTTKPSDPLALSWLLTNRDADFDADFLIDCFDTSVKKVIEWEARERKPYSEAGMGGEIGLGVEGDRLLDRNPKVAILNAISHNPEAAYRLQTEFQPFKLEVYHQTSEVQIDSIAELLYRGGEYGGYGDDGSSLGRMLNTTHQALLQEGNTAEAQRFVEQITNAATNNDEVERAQSYLREIGVRHQLNDDQAENARRMVEENSKHPARELLLGQIESNLKASAEFVKDAAAGSKYTQKSLYETQGGWDVVRHAMTAKDATDEQRANAETTLEAAIKKVGEGQELNDAARRGMAESLALRFGDLAYALFSPRDAPAKGWINASDADIEETLAEVSRDKQARETLMVGVGAYSSKTYDEMAKLLASGASNDQIMSTFAPEMAQMGKAFCKIVTAAQDAGVKEREEAMALLQRYRFGVDIVFDLVEQIPAVGTAKGIADKALGHLPGGIAPDYEESIRSGIAKSLSGVDMDTVVARTAEEAKETMSQVDVIVLENMMGAMARQPGLMVNLGLTSWGKWPPFMLADPPPPLDLPVDPANLSQFVKPEYLDPAGGVRLPVPGSPDYGSFQDWYFDPSLDNPLLERSMFITSEVRNSMNGCMMKTQWENSV